jgi:hypothetical protein
MASFLRRDKDQIVEMLNRIVQGDFVVVFEQDRDWGIFEAVAIHTPRQGQKSYVEVLARSFEARFHSSISVDFTMTLPSGIDVIVVDGNDIRAVLKTREEAEILADQLRSLVEDYNSTCRGARLKLEMAVSIIQEA